MSFREEWLRWMPATGLSNKYELKSYKDLRGEYNYIELYDSIKKQNVKMFFEGRVDIYQCTDIRHQGIKLAKVEKKYGENFIRNWSLFKVENSDFKEWGNEESGLIDYLFSDSNYAQYTFVTTNFIVDIITDSEPRIEIIDEI